MLGKGVGGVIDDHACTRRAHPRAGLLQRPGPPGMALNRNHEFPVVHQRRQMRGFSAGRRTEVEDPFTGLGNQQTGHEHRGPRLGHDRPAAPE